MKFTNSRGYTAEVLVSNSERVIYNSYDRDGKILQLNNCLPRSSFTRDWN